VREALAWKPEEFAEQRLSTLVCLLLDTGLRISDIVHHSPNVVAA
jgi:hypothetical protein